MTAGIRRFELVLSWLLVLLCYSFISWAGYEKRGLGSTVWRLMVHCCSGLVSRFLFFLSP
jgi:hypothetical protein